MRCDKCNSDNADIEVYRESSSGEKYKVYLCNECSKDEDIASMLQTLLSGMLDKSKGKGHIFHDFLFNPFNSPFEDDLLPPLPKLKSPFEDDLLPPFPKLKKSLEDDLLPPFPKLKKSFEDDLLPPFPKLKKDESEDETCKLKCEACGTTLKELKKEGTLGCTQCYQALREVLAKALPNLEDERGYLGKYPMRSAGQLKIENLQSRFQKLMKEAIAEEDYEQAAFYRDQIKLHDNLAELHQEMYEEEE